MEATGGSLAGKTGASVAARYHRAAVHPAARSLSLSGNGQRCADQNHRYRSPEHAYLPAPLQDADKSRRDADFGYSGA